MTQFEAVVEPCPPGTSPATRDPLVSLAINFHSSEEMNKNISKDTFETTNINDNSVLFIVAVNMGLATVSTLLALLAMQFTFLRAHREHKVRWSYSGRWYLSQPFTFRPILSLHIYIGMYSRQVYTNLYAHTQRLLMPIEGCPFSPRPEARAPSLKDSQPSMGIRVPLYRMYIPGIKRRDYLTLQNALALVHAAT